MSVSQKKMLSIQGDQLDREEIEKLISEHLRGAEKEFCRDRMARRVLLIPPDHTRAHSMAGIITQVLYKKYYDLGVVVDIMPAVGTHMQLSADERQEMFGDIPEKRFLTHDWCNDCVCIGEVPGEKMKRISGEIFTENVPIELDARIADGRYARVYSIGQVVPHEVVGMANHAKNLFVGCGGRKFISVLHLLGAVCGMENIIGKVDSPTRAMLDYAAELVAPLNITYIQTVVGNSGGKNALKGVFLGEGREPFEKAAELSQAENIFKTGKRFKHVVARLDGDEFHSTWVGNKAVYRTRMMIADGGTLTIIAPGVSTFGESGEIDEQIRKFGYCGRERVLSLLNSGEDISGTTAAHLIHGSSEGRFDIIYSTKHLSEAEVRSAGYSWMPLEKAEQLYGGLHEGVNLTADGEEIYYVGAPALGLWTAE